MGKTNCSALPHENNHVMSALPHSQGHSAFDDILVLHSHEIQIAVHNHASLATRKP